MKLSKIANTARPNGFFGRLISIFGRIAAAAALFLWSVAAHSARAAGAGGLGGRGRGQPGTRQGLPGERGQASDAGRDGQPDSRQRPGL